MIRLGHPNIPDDATTIETLMENTDIEHLSTSSVHWSNDDMWRWHTKILHGQPEDVLAPLLTVALAKDGLDLAADKALDFANIMAGNLNKVEDVLQFKRLLVIDEPLAAQDILALQETGAEFFKQAIATWHDLGEIDWQVWTTTLKDVSGHKGKQLFLPLRLALTGQPHGPEMSRVVLFLGKEEVELRLNHVLDIL